MTRKDYIRLARALAESRPAADSGLRNQWQRSLLAIARELKADNQRFDVERFVTAAHAGDVGFDSAERLALSRRYARDTDPELPGGVWRG